MINVQTIRKDCWSLFLAVVFFGLLGPSNIEGFWYVYLTFVGLYFSWAIYLINACERYVLYFCSYVAVVFVFSYLASSGAYISMSSVLGKASPLAIVLGLAPFALTCMVFAIIAHSKPSGFPFEIVGNRVSVISKKSHHKKYNLLFVAGVSTLIGNILLESLGGPTVYLVATIGCTAISIYLLFAGRHFIRGLRTLHNREHGMPTRYTFMQIEELREARGRWWLGRLFKWIASKFKQHSA